MVGMRILVHTVLAVLASIVLVSAFSVPSSEVFQLKSSVNFHSAVSRTDLRSVANVGHRRMFPLPKLRISGNLSNEELQKKLEVLTIMNENLTRELDPLTSLSSVLDSNLPKLLDMSKTDTTSFTVSSGSRKPLQVKRWDVRKDVIKYRESLSSDILSKKIRKLPFFETQPATQESILHVEFWRIVGKAISDITDAAGMPMVLKMLSGVQLEEAESAENETADFLLVELQPDPIPVAESPVTASTKRKNVVATRNKATQARHRILAKTSRSAGECKRHNLCLSESETDLVGRYNGSKDVVTCAFEQLVGYMVKYKAEYGFLTTYNWLWLVRIDENRNLCVSEAFSADTTGSASLLNAMNYLCNLVSQGKRNFLPPPFDLGFRKSTQVGIQAKQTCTDKGGLVPSDPEAVEQENDGDDTGRNSSLINTSIEVVAEFQEHHEDRLCFVARRYGEEDSELFVVKGFSEEWKRDRELDLYLRLQDLQGRGIPRLAHSSVVLHDHPDRQHGLVLEWAGKDLAATDKAPAPSVMSQLRDIICKMHCLGVVHCDIATRNVAWRQKTDRISVLDLGDAQTAEELGPEEFAHMCQADLTAMEEVMAEIQEEANGWAGVDEVPARV